MSDFSRFVEAQLIGISISESTELIEFKLRDVEGAEFSLLATGVSRFLANEMRERNIVDRINIWSSENWSDAARAELTQLLIGSQTPVDREKMSPIVSAEIEAIARGSRLLVEIEPVYGVSVLVLCERLEIKG
jgi:hypothetical protein